MVISAQMVILAVEQLALVKHAEKEMARRARLHTLLQLGYLHFEILRPVLARRQERLDARRHS